ncbi:fasciclin domain-containing protein, partial [Flavicella sp.]|uniref:fasciclin domain-containing protein n=1 Tax=Flavicella sp. TaxID=2957742 RepID=UPI00260B72B8
MKNFLSKITPIALIIILTLTACNDNDDTNEMMDMEDQPQTIAQIATADENFSILVDALTRTDLVGVVSDASANLTVFAPTNAAFADLLAELNMSSLDEVETALTTEGLKNVLLYHVLGAEVKSSSVSTGYVATATEDKLSFYVNTSDGV